MSGGFIPVDDWDQAQETMRRMEDEANSLLTDEQKAITWGSPWMRLSPEMGVVVFGLIWTREQMLASDPEAFPHYEESHARGYRFGGAWSDMTPPDRYPQGELGDTHIYDMVPITPEEFEQAKAVGFNTAEVVNLPFVKRAIFLDVARGPARQGVKAVVMALPSCDLAGRGIEGCPDEPHPADCDGKTRFGPWANMCVAAWLVAGVGLGMGKGQVLVQAVAP